MHDWEHVCLHIGTGSGTAVYDFIGRVGVSAIIFREIRRSSELLDVFQIGERFGRNGRNHVGVTQCGLVSYHDSSLGDASKGEHQGQPQR